MKIFYSFVVYILLSAQILEAQMDQEKGPKEPQIIGNTFDPNCPECS